MPENEILAPVYIKGKYVTAVYPLGHGFRLYFATGCSFVPGPTGDENNWHLLEGSTDRGSVDAIVHGLFSRAAIALPAHSSISEIELWHSVPSAPNVLDHFNTLPSGNDYGSGAGVASAYDMQVYGGALRNYFRFTFFDGANVAPQKYPPVTPPSSDDGSLAWYWLNSNIPFATNDGIRLIRMVSENVGYNKKLARSYGRTITP